MLVQESRLKEVTHFLEHQIFGIRGAFAFRMNEFLQDSNRLVCRCRHWDEGVAFDETQQVTGGVVARRALGRCLGRD